MTPQIQYQGFYESGAVSTQTGLLKEKKKQFKCEALTENHETLNKDTCFYKA